MAAERATRRARSTRTSPPRRTCSSPSTSGAWSATRRTSPSSFADAAGRRRAAILRVVAAVGDLRRAPGGRLDGRVPRVLGARPAPPGAPRALRRGRTRARSEPFVGGARALRRPAAASTLAIPRGQLATAMFAMEHGLGLERLTRPGVGRRRTSPVRPGGADLRGARPRGGRERSLTMDLSYERKRLVDAVRGLSLARALCGARALAARAAARRTSRSASTALVAPRGRALAVLARAARRTRPGRAGRAAAARQDDADGALRRHRHATGACAATSCSPPRRARPRRAATSAATA